MVDVVVGGGVLIVVGVGVETAGGCGQYVDTLLTGAGRLDGCWPGGSEKVRTCPVISVTVTVQLDPEATDAAGSAATPATALKMPSVTSATFSFARPNTVAVSPPDGSCTSVHPRHVPTEGASNASY